MLGVNVANNLFGEGVDPTDEQIRVRNQIFRVLGVMTPKGAGAGGMSQDDQMFAPYTTVMKKLSGQPNINQHPRLDEVGRSRSPSAQTAIGAELRTRHGTGERCEHRRLHRRRRRTTSSRCARSRRRR